MSASFFFGTTITLLVLILTVQSVYNPYLYDDGHGGEEHCCVVRVRENFCLATPITRSLIQVNKQCSRVSRRNRNNEYLDKISRRLDVQKVHEDDEKIFIRLQKPLEKNILQKDLICLTSTNNNINLEQCYVDLADDLYEDHASPREHRRRKHRSRQQNVNQIKPSVLKSDEKKNGDDAETSEAEKETYQMEISGPIRVREGHGFSFLKQYPIDLSHTRPTNPKQRRCWSWYRDQTRKLRRNRSKSCVPLSVARENCINQLIHITFNQTERDQPTRLSFPIGSKLFCKNHNNHVKLLGHYHQGEICFDAANQVHIEYEFSDIARLSNLYKNKDTLQFIANDDKLTAEFEDDCHNKTNLVEATESIETTSIENSNED